MFAIVYDGSMVSWLKQKSLLWPISCPIFRHWYLIIRVPFVFLNWNMCKQIDHKPNTSCPDDCIGIFEDVSILFLDIIIIFILCIMENYNDVWKDLVIVVWILLIFIVYVRQMQYALVKNFSISIILSSNLLHFVSYVLWMFGRQSFVVWYFYFVR